MSDTTDSKDMPNGVNPISNVDTMGRDRFEAIKASLEHELSEIDAIGTEVQSGISEIKAEVLGFKNLTSKLFKQIAGAASPIPIPSDASENREKTLRDKIEILKTKIPMLIGKISSFILTAQQRLDEIKTLDFVLKQDIENYKLDIISRGQSLKKLFGPLGSTIFGIASTYLKAVQALNNIKKALKAIKVAEFATTLGPALVFVAIGIVIFAFVFIASNPLKTFSEFTPFETICKDVDDDSRTDDLCGDNLNKGYVERTENLVKPTPTKP